MPGQQRERRIPQCRKIGSDESSGEEQRRSSVAAGGFLGGECFGARRLSLFLPRVIYTPSVSRDRAHEDGATRLYCDPRVSAILRILAMALIPQNAVAVFYQRNYRIIARSDESLSRCSTPF